MSEKEFVTVVAVEAGGVPEEPRSPSGFVTVVSVGADPPQEEVLVYRLPGERLGFGLKFEGGVKTAETVRRLFIQSCAIDSPASRTETSWGGLREGDEVIAIDEAPVNEMTRLACVHRLKDSPVVLKLLVVHHPLPEPSSSPPLVVSETVKQPPPPPPPIPPRKKQHKEQPPPPPRGFEDQSKTKKTFAFDIATVPPEAEVYLDLIRHEEQNRLNGESESDDTGSSISTVVDRGLLSSLSTTCNSSLDSLNIDIAKVLGPFEKLERELDEDETTTITTSSSSNSLQPPLSFQDAPLSYGDEKMPQLIADPELDEEEAPALPPKPMPRKEMNNNCVKVCKQRAPTPTDDEEHHEIKNQIEHELINGDEEEMEEERVDDDDEVVDEDDDEDMFPEWAMNDLKLPNGPEDTEFKVTSVLSSEASFFPFHWGVSSHLATIGEDEEEDDEAEEFEQETIEEQKTSYGPEISLQLENRVRPSSPPPPPPPLLLHRTTQQQQPPTMTKDPIEQLPQINGELIIDKEEIQVPLEDIIQEEEARNNMLEINNHHNCQQLQQPQDLILNKEPSPVLSSSVPTIETSPPSISSGEFPLF